MRAVILLMLVLPFGCADEGASADGGSGAGTASSMGGAGSLPPPPGQGGGPRPPAEDAPVAPRSDAGGPATSQDGSAGGAATNSQDASDPSCRFQLAGSPCAPAGASCASDSACASVRCDCRDGAWACSERQIPCGGTCPTPQQARCGEPCTGMASGCLCQCGGGPNYAGCSCSGGRWQCACGGR